MIVIQDNKEFDKPLKVSCTKWKTYVFVPTKAASWFLYANCNSSEILWVSETEFLLSWTHSVDQARDTPASATLGLKVYTTVQLYQKFLNPLMNNFRIMSVSRDDL